ncbi:substrate-binding domain-containing protein, partial [Escherichia coli]|uniref:substrate-binding domain-containing protein n=2 Tax=Pseudomonadota TaxID=1224 RepID=UPI00165542CB
ALVCAPLFSMAYAQDAKPAGAPTAAVQDKTLTVFAAASMKNALDEANAAYTAKTGVKVVSSYAASSALAKQLE